MFQRIVLFARCLMPRGWSTLLIIAARCFKSLRCYPSALVDGTVFYLDLSQRMCHGIFFLQGQPHEYGTEKIMKHLLSEGDTFIDVGANVGFYTVIAKRLVGFSGKVVSIEPQPNALRLLKENASIGYNNVTIYPVAVSDTEGDMTFYLRNSGDTSSLLAIDADADADVDEKIIVHVGTLDKLLSNVDHVKLIKIDVEGFELQVLRGAKSVIVRNQPYIYFELLEEFIASGNIVLDDLKDFFSCLNYTCFYISHSRDEELLSANKSTYVLAIPKNQLESFSNLPCQVFG